LADGSSTYNKLVLSATTFSNTGSYTDYDFVTITELEQAVSVPEPVNAILLGIGLLALLAAARVRLWRRL